MEDQAAAEVIEESAPSEEITEVVEVVEATEGAELAPVEAAEAEEPAPSEKMQKRIDKVTADKYEAIRKANELEDRLRAVEAANVKPEANEPTLEQFDFDEEKYIDAKADWKANKTLNARAQEASNAAAVSAQNARMNAHYTRVDAFKEATPDFVQTVQGALAPFSADVADRIVAVPEGPELLYYLAKPANIAALEEVNAMSRDDAVIRLNEIAKELKAQPKSKKLTDAPPPVSTVKGGGGAPNGLGKYGDHGATFDD